MQGPGRARDRRSQWARAWALASSLALALATVGAAALAQDRKAARPDADEAPAAGPRERPAKGKAKAKKGGLRVPGAVPKGAIRKGAADPLAGNAPRGGRPPDPQDWPFHYTFKLAGEGGTPMEARYYPSRLGASAPAILLVHEKAGSGKDFEDPIDELKGKGLAETLQVQGYATLVVDFRGAGAGPRGEPAHKEWRGRLGDLQAAYQFLVDRNNRQELNLAKLGVVALGEGANLSALWAITPGGATSSEGRLGDLAALALISPAAAIGPARFEKSIAPLAPRVPLLLMGGERDAVSKIPIATVRAMVDRQRLSKVITYPTALHGARLVRFTPEAPGAIIKFLDTTLKSRKDDWEPRYILSPVAFTDATLVLPKAKNAPAPKAGADRKVAQPDAPGAKPPANKRAGKE